MTDSLTIQTAPRAYTRRDQRFVDLAVRERRQDAVEFLDAGLRFLRSGLDAKADRAFLIDTAKGLHDAVSNLVGGMRKDLDDAYLPTEGADIDLSELDGIIQGVD